MDEVEFPPVVDLLVGQRRFTTALSTLRKFPDSMLASMFSGRIGVLQKDGAYFIDREGESFGLILDYLRDGDAELPADAGRLRGLLRDACFFGLSGLQELIAAKLARVEVVIEASTGDFNCTDEQCNCGGDNMSPREMFLHNPHQMLHPRNKQVPVVDTPFLTLEVALQICGGGPADEVGGLEAAHEALLPILRRRFAQPGPAGPAWKEEAEVAAQVRNHLLLLARESKVMQCEFVENVLEYDIGDEAADEVDWVTHHRAYLRLCFRRKRPAAATEAPDGAKRRRLA